MSGVRVSDGSPPFGADQKSSGRGGMADAPDLGSGVSDVRVRVSSPAPIQHYYAVVAQLVERNLAKVEVASPSLVYRSIFFGAIAKR